MSGSRYDIPGVASAIRPRGNLIIVNRPRSCNSRAVCFNNLQNRGYKPIYMQPHPGQIITAPFLPTQAEVKKFELRPGYSLLEVPLEDGHHTCKALHITADQLAQIQVTERNPVVLSGSAKDFSFLSRLTSFA